MKKHREYTVIIEQDEDGYFVAEVPALKSCYTQARSMDELMERLREVIELCESEQKPKTRTRFIGVQRFAL
ncbi:type II toxin-antitoxin system HicB family antitoxin [bacterium]|nr:type II toxin-antitoxin system HicB family antitoxin [bacterium]